MSIADADRLDWMSRYLAGRLSDADAEKFEAAWATNPQWTTDLENEARLRVGLADLRHNGTLDAAVRGHWWRNSLRVMTLAASVAAIAVAIAIGSWQFASQAPAVALARAPSRVIGDSIAIMRMRSAAPAAATILLPPEPRSIELRVLPGVRPGTSASDVYRLSIASGTAATEPASATLDGLQIASDGFIRAYVDSRGLVPGRYRLTLSVSGATETESFILDVQSAGSKPHVD